MAVEQDEYESLRQDFLKIRTERDELRDKIEQLECKINHINTYLQRATNAMLRAQETLDTMR